MFARSFAIKGHIWRPEVQAGESRCPRSEGGCSRGSQARAQVLCQSEFHHLYVGCTLNEARGVGLLARCVSPQPACVLWDQAAAFPAWSCPGLACPSWLVGKRVWAVERRGVLSQERPGRVTTHCYGTLAESLPFSGPLFAIIAGRG